MKRMDKGNNSSALLLKGILILSLLLVNGRIAAVGMPFACESGSLPTLLYPTPRIIMIYGSGERKNVAPVELDKLWVDRFTEITWINASQTDVRIRFGKGTKCKEISTATFPGLGIRLDPRKCFVTGNPIPPQGKLWFRFVEPGDYKYEVEYLGKNEKLSGEIKVF